MERGLERFYELSDLKADFGQVMEPTGSDYTWVDSSSEITEIDVGDLKEAAFPIAGIHCAGCVWLLEKLHKIAPGVVYAKAQVTTGEITVRYDPKLTKKSIIAQALDSFGYPLAGKKDQTPESSILRLGIAAFCFMNIMMLSVSLHQGGMEEDLKLLFQIVCFFLSIPLVWIGAAPFFKNALFAIRLREPHLDIPIVLAIVTSFIYSTYEIGRGEVYFDSIAALIFLLLVGRFLQEGALRRARNALSKVWAITPLTARKVNGDEVPTDSLVPGMEIKIASGERVPTTIKLSSEPSEFDESTITGEALPVLRSDLVEAGSLNVGKTVTGIVTERFRDTRLARAIKSQHGAALQSSEEILFLKNMIRWFTIILLSVATVNFFVWPNWSDAIRTTVALLLVACPCGVGMAIPLLLSHSIRCASREGILIRSANALVKRVAKVFIDKTGTLTEPILKVVSVSGDPEGFKKGASITPSHPISRSLRNHFGEQSVRGEQIPGVGVRWKEAEDTFELKKDTSERTSVSLYKNGEFSGRVEFESSIKSGAKDLSKLVGLTILSGDKREPVREISEVLGVKEYFSDLLPEKKREIISKSSSIMIGDGFNDREALKAADIGIGLGGAITSDSSSVMITDGKLEGVIKFFKARQKLYYWIKLVVGVSVFYNLVGGTLAVTGVITPLIAAILMPIMSFTLVSLALIINPFKA